MAVQPVSNTEKAMKKHANAAATRRPTLIPSLAQIATAGETTTNPIKRYSDMFSSSCALLANMTPEGAAGLIIARATKAAKLPTSQISKNFLRFESGLCAFASTLQL
jgi:hypothetical protein